MDDFRLRTLASRDGDAVQEAVRGALKEVWSALPVLIQKDSDGHTAALVSAVKLPILQLDGTVQLQEYTVFDTSPVHYPGGGGVTHTHPVKKDDEALAIFTSRAQDSWHEKGGIQDPIDYRSHHLADSRLIPGGRSDPRKMNPPPSTSSQQNRSDDGNHVMDVHPQNGITHASTQKHLVNVGGTGDNGAGTAHLPAKIIKNAKKVLINCIQADNLPKPGDSFANKKLIATKPVSASSASSNSSSSSAISSIMQTVMSGGIGSVLSNPTAAAGGSLSSAITNAVTQATTAFGSAGAAPIVAALTGSGGAQGLTAALGGLVAGAGSLSGATAAPTGSFGLSDLVSHAQGLSQFFGNDVPGSVSLSTVLAPLQASPAIAAAEQSLLATMNAVLNHSITPVDAAAAIEAQATQLAAIMPAANAALSALQAAAPAMALAQLAASLVGSLDANEGALGKAIGNPNLNALAASVNLLFEPTGADAAAILAFPDSGTDQPGAQAGFASAAA